MVVLGLIDLGVDSSSSEAVASMLSQATPWILRRTRGGSPCILTNKLSGDSWAMF